MKSFLFSLSLLISFQSVFCQKPITIELHDAVNRNKIHVVNREMTLINEKKYQGIRLSKAYGE